MCEYTKVEYACGHLRFTVRAWCIKYQESHKRCPANVVAVEYRLDERCGKAALGLESIHFVLNNHQVTAETLRQ
ncbi:uncharacterized protein MYCGRDRAFT_39210 [Zymoseptoria tritici IPO323]|uniref:Uncharacterized protein n=1 Tax=Zymoseptoria tritici (strain CBS 115943 / IPO323) TaxID=336722 RepID=F9X7L7_ZYMTI|nr:uncharacterized protein MYCGRDRAFT_39210 [Zymoseptoria tritici IPO323]EGP88666.1 hypothetical protein MYCGRDRAFT_39210 [Zymoseptoria tritici IPO323]